MSRSSHARRTVSFVGAIAVPAFMAACGGPEIRFADSVDLELDFRTTSGSSLHAPYVEGAMLRVHARDAAVRDAIDLDGYTLASSDEEVLAIEPEGDASANAHAAGHGVADLLLLDPDGEVIASAEVEVRTPTRAVLHAAAPLFLHRDDVPTEAFDPAIVAGGLATFAVSYYDGATQLHGSGTLGVASGVGVDARTADTHLFEERDWLSIAPQSAGLHDLELSAEGKPFAHVQVEAVDTEAIADLELRGQNESRAKPDDELVVIAQAYDDEGDRIFGAAFDWELAGAPDGEKGDLYRYAYRPADGKPLAASFGELRSEAMIHADRGEVDSSNHIGCSVNGRTSWTSALGLLVLVVCRRRPRRSPPSARA